MGNTFGQLFRITTWGESHGGGVGVIVDGCPPRLELSETDIQPDLDRRRPGQSSIVTPRKESDRVEILSGVFEGRILGTPISMWVKNEDARPEAYSQMATKFRRHFRISFGAGVLVLNPHRDWGAQDPAFKDPGENFNAIRFLAWSYDRGLTWSAAIEVRLNVSFGKLEPGRTTIHDDSDAA